MTELNSIAVSCMLEQAEGKLTKKGLEDIHSNLVTKDEKWIAEFQDQVYLIVKSWEVNRQPNLNYVYIIHDYVMKAKDNASSWEKVLDAMMSILAELRKDSAADIDKILKVLGIWSKEGLFKDKIAGWRKTFGRLRALVPKEEASKPTESSVGIASAAAPETKSKKRGRSPAVEGGLKEDSFSKEFRDAMGQQTIKFLSKVFGCLHDQYNDSLRESGRSLENHTSLNMVMFSSFYLLHQYLRYENAKENFDSVALAIACIFLSGKSEYFFIKSERLRSVSQKFVQQCFGSTTVMPQNQQVFEYETELLLMLGYDTSVLSENCAYATIVRLQENGPVEPNVCRKAWMLLCNDTYLQTTDCIKYSSAAISLAYLVVGDKMGGCHSKRLKDYTMSIGMEALQSSLNLLNEMYGRDVYANSSFRGEIKEGMHRIKKWLSQPIVNSVSPALSTDSPSSVININKVETAVGADVSKSSSQLPNSQQRLGGGVALNNNPKSSLPPRNPNSQLDRNGPRPNQDNRMNQQPRYNNDRGNYNQSAPFSNDQSNNYNINNYPRNYYDNRQGGSQVNAYNANGGNQYDNRGSHYSNSRNNDGYGRSYGDGKNHPMSNDQPFGHYGDQQQYSSSSGGRKTLQPSLPPSHSAVNDRYENKMEYCQYVNNADNSDSGSTTRRNVGVNQHRAASRSPTPEGIQRGNSRERNNNRSPRNNRAPGSANQQKRSRSPAKLRSPDKSARSRRFKELEEGEVESDMGPEVGNSSLRNGSSFSVYGGLGNDAYGVSEVPEIPLDYLHNNDNVPDYRMEPRNHMYGGSPLINKPPTLNMSTIAPGMTMPSYGAPFKNNNNNGLRSPPNRKNKFETVSSNCSSYKKGRFVLLDEGNDKSISGGAGNNSSQRITVSNSVETHYNLDAKSPFKSEVSSLPQTIPSLLTGNAELASPKKTRRDMPQLSCSPRTATKKLENELSKKITEQVVDDSKMRELAEVFAKDSKAEPDIVKDSRVFASVDSLAPVENPLPAAAPTIAPVTSLSTTRNTAPAIVPVTAPALLISAPVVSSSDETPVSNAVDLSKNKSVTSDASNDNIVSKTSIEECIKASEVVSTLSVATSSVGVQDFLKEISVPKKTPRKDNIAKLFSVALGSKSIRK